METRERLGYIDFMKGFCILIIVAFHINNEIYPHKLNLMLQSFRIPLYYFLSGLFFKQYSGFVEFFRRKFNNIIVPYFFFMLLTCSIHCVLTLGVGVKWMGEWTWWSLLDPFMCRYYHYNTPLWFLISLFEVNIVYYLLQNICPKRSGRYALMFLMAFVAWYFRKTPVFNGCLYLDTVFMAMPYFVLGNEIKSLGLLKKNKRFDKWGYAVIVPVCVMLYFCSSKINLLIQSVPQFYKLYTVPFVAILTLFWFSKNLPKVPIVNYIGRYSIVVLGTHIVLIKLVKQALVFVMVQHLGLPGVNEWLIFAAVVLCELAVIPLMIRLFPKFTAQKELIKPLLLKP